jgi:hypothetical protein
LLYQNETIMKTINQTNFHLSTYGRFQVVEQPNRTPDYISYTTWGEISSIYYYENNGVIRVSNHWGAVASCQWNLEGLNEMGWDKCRKTDVVAGFISFEELTRIKNLQIKQMELRAEGKIEEAKAVNFLSNF